MYLASFIDNNCERMNYSSQKSCHLIQSTQNNDKYGNLYLGNISGATDYNFLDQNNIKAVISIVNSKNAPQYENKKDIRDNKLVVNHLLITVEDQDQTDLTEYFQETYDFIENNLKNWNVLVHCMAGVSRSATIVIQFLMKYNNETLRESYSKVRKIRNIIGPNQGFMNQLKDFDYKINNLNSEFRKYQNQIY